jgi:FkbM family methyltransferase
MSKIDLNKIEKSVVLSRGTRIQRLSKAPRKILYSKILELFALLFGKPIRVKARTFWGEDMLVVIPEVVSLNIYRYGFFEEGLTRMLFEHLKPGMTFFDIGAHFGYFSLLASYLVGDKGQVHVFEPTPSTFDILRTNVSNKNNVFLNNNAVFSRGEIVSINDYGVKYSAFNSIYNGNLSLDIIEKIGAKRYQVEAFSVDEYVGGRGVAPDFVKIDAESAEYEILQGMEMTIDEYRPKISLEVGDMNVRDATSSKKLINFLINKGYKPYEYKEGKTELHLLKTVPYQYDNILFLQE